MAKIGILLNQKYQEEMIACLAPFHTIKTWTSLEQAVVDLKDAITTSTIDRFGLIIVSSDVENQRLTIFEFLKWIRKDLHYAKLPFLIVESRVNEVPSCVVNAVRQVGNLFGATNHLVLDVFSPRIFIQTVDSCLQQS